MKEHSTPAERRIADWQFALLRFAVTRAPLDRAVAVANATELDAAALRTSPFSFFARNTDEICDAIAATANERSVATLRTFAMRIEDVRLKAAFSAAAGLQDRSGTASNRSRALWRERQDLWRGLPKR